MALVSRMVSDISGAEAPEADFVQLVVREHPAVESAVALDVLPDEIAKLKSAAEVVVLEVRQGAETKQVFVTLSEFRKLVKDDVIKGARSLRGRRPGFSPVRPAAPAAEVTPIKPPAKGPKSA